MGFLDRLFHRRPRGTTYAQTLDGFVPLFSQFGQNIYASDVVRQALKCIADEMKKLNPQHVRYITKKKQDSQHDRYVGSDLVPVRSALQDVLDEPNALMTWADFIEKSTYHLLMNDNVFIVPIYHT